MNTVKPFDPQGLAHIELGSVKLNKIVLEHNSRQIMPGGKGIRVSQNGTGVTISAVRQRQPSKTYLPFEITTSSAKLRAAPGLFHATHYSETVQLGPLADGEWFFQATVSIDSATGSVTGTNIEFTQTQGTNDGTDFFFTLGRLTVTDGSPSPAEQYNYGPLTVVLHGDATDVWAATLF